jgi:hypothetical protein
MMQGYEDLLDHFSAAEKLEETQSYDFRDDTTQKFLGRGWSVTLKGGGWASSLLSELEFHTFFSGEDHSGAFVCLPFSYAQAPQQTIDLYLNGYRISHILLEKRKRPYSFPLPSQYLREGKNIPKNVLQCMNH